LRRREGEGIKQAGIWGESSALPDQKQKKGVLKKGRTISGQGERKIEGEKRKAKERTNFRVNY